MTRARDLADGKFTTDVEVENSTAGAQNMVVIHHASKYKRGLIQDTV